MAKIRGAKRFFRIGREDVAKPYGTPALGFQDPAITGAGKDMRFFFIHEGGFSIHMTNIAEEQQVLRGQLGIIFRERTGTSVAGDMSVLAHPDNIRWFLDMGLVRDVNGELHPHTIQEFYPGIDAVEKGASYVGCKSSQLAGAWGTGQNKVQITVSVQGQREAAYLTPPNTIPDPTVPGVFPQKAGYVFASSSLIDGLALTSGSWPYGSFMMPVSDYTDVSFTVANNLTEGPRAFHPDAELRGAITDLLAGQERLSGNFTLQWRDKTILDRVRNFSDCAFRNIFVHPTSVSNRTFSAVGLVGSTPTTVTYTGGTLIGSWPFTPSIAEPAVIAIQHGASGATGVTATQWSTALVTGATAADLTLAGVDIAIATGDRIWTEAMEIRFANVNLMDAPKSGGPEDAVVTIAGTFEGKALAGATQLLYRCRGAALPVSP